MLSQQTVSASGHALCAEMFSVSPAQLDWMGSPYFRKVLLIRPVSSNSHFSIFLKDLSMDGGNEFLELIKTNSTANSPLETIRLGKVLLGDILNVKLYHVLLNNISLSAVIFIQLELFDIKKGTKLKQMLGMNRAYF